MASVKILDCTLRDGGYITKWHFENEMIKDTIVKLVNANIDYIECGYLNNKPYETNTSIFHNIEQIADFIPQNPRNSMFLAMADVAQYSPDDITPYTGNSIDGIRVVFYKHQIEDALTLCRRVIQCGYKLFVQPMVTIDYTKHEYANLVSRIAQLSPSGVSIVDSFGYMDKNEFKRYFQILDSILEQNVAVGFHSHNNMQLAFISAQDVFEYDTERELIIDASLNGMGRGAGNLNTEIITNYYNTVEKYKYNVEIIINLISKYILPIKKNNDWGYSPFMFLTGLYHCHPNFACYLLEDHHDVTVSEFRDFIQMIPAEMKTKCRKPYVEKLYQYFNEKRSMIYERY